MLPASAGIMAQTAKIRGAMRRMFVSMEMVKQTL
jgi:hypothetical protein